MSRQLLRNSFSGLSGMALHKLVHLVTMIVLARMLGAEQFGIYAFVGAMVFFFGFLTDLGMERVLTRELSAKPHEARVLLGTALWLRLGLGFLAAGIGASVGWVLALDRVTFVCLVLALATLPFGFDLLARAYFQSRLEIRHYYRITLAGSATFLLLVCLCWWWQGSVVAVFALGLANALLFSALFLRAVLVRAGISPFAELGRARSLLREGFQIGLLALLFMTALRVDQILLFQLRGAEEAGQYAAAVRLTEALGMFSEAVMLSLFPLLAASHRSNPKAFRHRYQLGFRYLAATGTMLALACSYLAPDLLRVVFGQKYAAAWPAAVFLSWNLLLSYLGAVYVNVFLIECWYRLLLLVSALSVAVNIAFNLLWIPAYGSAGAAAATLLSSAIGFVSWFVFPATRSVLVDCVRSSAPAITAGVLSACVGVALLQWRGTHFALLSLVLYVVLLVAVGGLARSDLRRLYASSPSVPG